MSEPLFMSTRVSRQGVVCEISFTAPADAFKAEMTTALEAALREIRTQIDERYAAPKDGHR